MQKMRAVLKIKQIKRQVDWRFKQKSGLNDCLWVQRNEKSLKPFTKIKLRVEKTAKIASKWANLGISFIKFAKRNDLHLVFKI